MEHDQSRESSIIARLNLSPKNGIPMPDYHIMRTESELQLNEDMAMAEYRDKCMFNRLVTGIQQRRQQHYDSQQHQYYYGQSGNSTTTRRSRTRVDNTRTPLPRSMLIPTQTDIDQGQESDRTIANILYTRRPSSTQGKESPTRSTVNSDVSTMITPITSDGEDSRPDDDAGTDDWAIEGFDDEPPSPSYSRRVICYPWQDSPVPFQSSHAHATFNQSDNNLFDMDL